MQRNADAPGGRSQPRAQTLSNSTAFDGASILQVMGHIFQLEDRPAPARQLDVDGRLRLLIVPNAAGEVTVIVVLVQDGDGLGSINQRPAFPSGAEQHPVIPPRPADGEIGDILKTFTGINKIIAPVWPCSLPPAATLSRKRRGPISGEIKRFGHIQIVALSHRQKTGFASRQVAGCFHKSGKNRISALL